jgi:sugar-phosphatase
LVSSDDIVHGKPDPAGYLAAARRLAVRASRCLVFEDAPAGIRAGIASGARVVVVVGQHQSALTRSLHRVPDLSAICATTTDGVIRLEWVQRP